MKDKTNCNNSEVNKSMDVSIEDIANTEAGTDVYIPDDAILKELQINNEFALDEGVTDNAPYKFLSDYRMVTPGLPPENEPFDTQES